MDAMGVQTEIVRLIRQKKADYVVTPQKESSNSLQTSQDLVLKSQSKPIWWN